MPEPTSQFVKVKCADCSNEQVVFSKASTPVACVVCGTALATPTGGQAKITAEVIEEVQ